MAMKEKGKEKGTGYFVLTVDCLLCRGLIHQAHNKDKMIEVVIASDRRERGNLIGNKNILS